MVLRSSIRHSKVAMNDTGGCLARPQSPRYRVLKLSCGSTGHRTQSNMPSYPCCCCVWLAYDNNRLYCRVAIMPQMAFLPVPISSCFRLVVRRHSTMETKDRHCAAFRSSLAGPCSLRWPLPFSLSLPIEHVAVHRWTLKWSGLVNRRFLQALSVLTWWPR